jgi:hypothetical protein
MPCLFCHEYCGDKSFCGSDCYEAYEEARAEYLAKSECDALLDTDKPFNEDMGTKGNE